MSALDKDDVRAVMLVTCQGIEVALRLADYHKGANIVRGLAVDLELGELGAMETVDQVCQNLARQAHAGKRIEVVTLPPMAGPYALSKGLKS